MKSPLSGSTATPVEHVGAKTVGVIRGGGAMRVHATIVRVRTALVRTGRRCVKKRSEGGVTIKTAEAVPDRLPMRRRYQAREREN